MYYYDVVPWRVTSQDKESLTYSAKQPVKIGQIVQIPLGSKSGIGLVISKTTRPKFATKELLPRDEPPLPTELVATLRWMATYYATPAPVVLQTILPRGLERKRRAVVPALPQQGRDLSPLKLSVAQTKALKTLKTSTGTAILHGETGSGKTLIYRELIKHQLEQGKSSLLLVPEIGLTPQAASDYRDLTEHIFVTHSGLTEAQRHQVWLNILQHESPIVVIGPRSALFSPLKKLGVVIIDEEHEPTYKQDTSPKYHTQTVAAHLTRQHSAQLILASATPRIQDKYLASQRQAAVVTMPPLFTSKPDIITIDRTNRDAFSRSPYMSNRLLSAIEDSLANSKQSLLYLNRRGTAPVVLCEQCGWHALCPRCDIGLTLHHDHNQLKCHQCGYNQPVPKHCPDCAFPDVRFRGVGTKKLENDLNKLFPGARIARFDSDSIKGEKLHERYDSLYQGKFDIIIGTQSIARSLDLPLVDTVGVISADSELLLPDFSAAERTFQLLYQVIGRVGRTSGQGTVVIQTYNPDHPAIKFATAHDYEGFFRHELKHRQEFAYPPHVHLLGFVVSYRSRANAKDKAQALTRNLAGRKLTVLGPTPAFYERQGRNYRWLVVAKSKSRSKLLTLAREFRSKHIQVDIDPSNLLF